MLRPMEISGASALVTGAASGIGAAVARQLAAAGAHVVVADLNAAGGEAEVRVFDVTHHHADGVRLARVHAARKFVGPVREFLGGSQHALPDVVAHGAVIAQGARGLGFGNLRGFGDVGDCDVAPPRIVAAHIGLPEGP